MGTDQLKELKRIQKENERPRRAVSDLTLDKLILGEAAKGNFQAPRGDATLSSWCGVGSMFPKAAPAGSCSSIARRTAMFRSPETMRSVWFRT